MTKIPFVLIYYVLFLTEDSLLRKTENAQTFILNHFQGTNPVHYNVKGWLKSARENPLARVAASVLQDSPK